MGRRAAAHCPPGSPRAPRKGVCLQEGSWQARSPVPTGPQPRGPQVLIPQGQALPEKPNSEGVSGWPCPLLGLASAPSSSGLPASVEWAPGRGEKQMSR